MASAGGKSWRLARHLGWSAIDRRKWLLVFLHYWHSQLAWLSHLAMLEPRLRWGMPAGCCQPSRKEHNPLVYRDLYSARR